MPPAKLSKHIESMLEQVLLVAGEREFTKEMAELYWGGNKAGKVKDLNQTQLLQYVLTMTWIERDMVAEQYDALVEEIKKQSAPRPNRAERRKASKNGLILP